MIAENIFETLDESEIIISAMSKKKEQHRVEIRRQKNNQKFRQNRLNISSQIDANVDLSRFKDYEQLTATYDNSDQLDLSHCIAGFLNAYESNDLQRIRFEVSNIRVCVTLDSRIKDLEESNQKLYNQNVLHLLVGYLSPQYDEDEDFELQRDVIWIISHFLSQSNLKHIQFIVSHVPITVFYRLIEHSKFQIKVNAILSLYNILDDNEAGAQYLIQGGIIRFIKERILPLLSQFPTLLPQTIVIVRELLGYAAEQPDAITMEELNPLFECLFIFFTMVDRNIMMLDNLFEAVHHITQRDDDEVDQFYWSNNGIILKILSYLNDSTHNDEAYLITPLKVILNLANSYDAITENMIQLGLLNVLNGLVKLNKTKINIGVASILTNVCTQGIKTIQYLIEHELILQDIFLLIQGPDFMLKKEALIALCHLLLTIGSKQIEEFAGSYQPIQVLLDNMQNADVDLNIKIVKAFLRLVKLGEIIKNKRQYVHNRYSKRFADCGGREKIEIFTENSNHKLKYLSEKLLACTYFIQTDDGDEDFGQQSQCLSNEQENTREEDDDQDRNVECNNTDSGGDEDNESAFFA